MAGPHYYDTPRYSSTTDAPMYNTSNDLPAMCMLQCRPINLEELHDQVVTITYQLSGCTGDECGDSPSPVTLVMSPNPSVWGNVFGADLMYQWVAYADPEDTSTTLASLTFSEINGSSPPVCHPWSLVIYGGDYLTACWIGGHDAGEGTLASRLYNHGSLTLDSTFSLCTGPGSIEVEWT